MRKILLAATLLTALAKADAQTLKDVQISMIQNKYDDAKTKLDKFLADPKNANSADAYFYKGEINTYYAQADSAGTLPYNASQLAFDSYKKALELDPKNKLMSDAQNIGFFQLFDLKYNRGVKSYNNKDYATAYKTFADAVALQDYVRAKNFSITSYKPPVLDTQLINLTATSAYLSKQEDAAIPYYQRIIDAKVTGKEYRDIYAIVAQYYLNKKDDASASKVLAVGKELYPDNDYWLSLEFGNVGTDNAAKLKRYEELMAKYPNNGALALDYAIEQFNNTYVWDKKPTDYIDRQAKLQTALDKAIALNPNNGTAYYIAAQHYYSQKFDIEDARMAVVGNTPAAVAKRKDLNTKVDAAYEKLAEVSKQGYDYYKAAPSLKGQDKNAYRKLNDYLIDYYSRKKMADKVAFYTAEKASIK